MRHDRGYSNEPTRRFADGESHASAGRLSKPFLLGGSCLTGGPLHTPIPVACVPNSILQAAVTGFHFLAAGGRFRSQARAPNKPDSPRVSWEALASRLHMIGSARRILGRTAMQFRTGLGIQPHRAVFRKAHHCSELLQSE